MSSMYVALNSQRWRRKGSLIFLKTTDYITSEVVQLESDLRPLQQNYLRNIKLSMFLQIIKHWYSKFRETS